MDYYRLVPTHQRNMWSFQLLLLNIETDNLMPYTLGWEFPTSNLYNAIYDTTYVCVCIYIYIYITFGVTPPVLALKESYQKYRGFFPMRETRKVLREVRKQTRKQCVSISPPTLAPVPRPPKSTTVARKLARKLRVRQNDEISAMMYTDPHLVCGGLVSSPVFSSSSVEFRKIPAQTKTVRGKRVRFWEKRVSKRVSCA